MPNIVLSVDYASSGLTMMWGGGTFHLDARQRLQSFELCLTDAMRPELIDELWPLIEPLLSFRYGSKPAGMQSRNNSSSLATGSALVDMGRSHSLMVGMVGRSALRGGCSPTFRTSERHHGFHRFFLNSADIRRESISLGNQDHQPVDLTRDEGGAARKFERG